MIFLNNVQWKNCIYFVSFLTLLLFAQMMFHENVFENYFDFSVALLKVSALWKFHHKTPTIRRYLYTFYNIFFSVYMYFIYFPTEVFYLTIIYKDLKGTAQSFRDIGNHIAAIIKAVNWFVMRDRILALMDTLQAETFNYEEYEEFKPKEIVSTTKNSTKTWTTNFLASIFIICFSMLSTGFYLFFFKAANQYVGVDEERYYAQELPVNVVTPFGTKTRATFLSTFLYVVFACTFYGCIIGALDNVFTSMVSCIGAHLLVLEGAIRTMRPRCMKRLRYNEEKLTNEEKKILDVEMQTELTKCCKHLQTILEICQHIEDIYYLQNLLQTLISLIEICSSLYLLSMELGPDSSRDLTYLTATSFQLFLYCWFGNMVTVASLAVREALYDCDWVSANVPFRKQIIFTMTRMQKPIYVTIGKISPMTFNTFLTIVRASYSAFTFLKQKDRVA